MYIIFIFQYFLYKKIIKSKIIITLLIKWLRLYICFMINYKNCFNEQLKDFGKPDKPATIKEIKKYGNKPSHHNYNNTNIVKLKEINKKRQNIHKLNTQNEIYSSKIVTFEEINKKSKKVINKKNTDKERNDSNINILKPEEINIVRLIKKYSCINLAQ